MNKQIFVACISALLGTALSGAVKPLAIWNGEFVAKSDTEIQTQRNGVSLKKNRNINCFTQYFRLGSLQGMSIECDDDVKIAQAIIANIYNLKQPDDFGVLFDFWSGDTEKFWLQIDSNWKIGASTPSGASWEVSAESVDNAVTNCFGMFTPKDGDKSFGLLNGVPVHTNTFTEICGGMRIGTRNTINQVTLKNSFQNARVTYVAIFPDDQNLSLEDFKTWSLNEMTRAETATNVVTAGAAAENAVLKGGDGVGINLLGGTFKVNGAARAHALFVQENSTIEFADAASLTLAGPVYIADGRELTLALADGAAAASLKAKHFADMNQITAAGGIAVGEAGGGEVAIEKPTLGTVVVDGEEVKPLEVVDGNVVFGVNTKPGLWYAVAASGDIETINGGDLKPVTQAFQADGESAKIAVPFPKNTNLMFYKVLAATSEDDLKGEEE